MVTQGWSGEVGDCGAWRKAKCCRDEGETAKMREEGEEESGVGQGVDGHVCEREVVQVATIIWGECACEVAHQALFGDTGEIF